MGFCEGVDGMHCRTAIADALDLARSLLRACGHAVVSKRLLRRCTM